MPNLSFALTQSDADKADNPRLGVILEQLPLGEQNKTATIAEVYRLWTFAKSGISAQSMRPNECPISFTETTIKIWLDFYAWPNSQELDYELSASIGDIGTVTIVDTTREQDVIFPIARYYDLDYLPLSTVLTWQTGTYLSDGTEVEKPGVTLNKNRIVLDNEVFGVARLKARAWGHQYRLTIEIVKGDNRIKDLAPVIIAFWKDEDGGSETDELVLELPACVQSALELCDGDFGDLVCHEEEIPTDIYYSTCSGDTLAILTDDQPESWCERI